MKILSTWNGRITSTATAAAAAVALLGGAMAHAEVPTYYWDTNGSEAGPGNPPSDIWSESSLNWSIDPYGSGATFAYDQRANIVFAANDSFWTETQDYTVSIADTVSVSDMTFKDGNATLTNLAGVIEKDTAPIGVLNQLETATIYSTISSAASTSNGITKYAFGILILAATNTYSGPTTIEGGILQLGAPQVLPPTSPLILANGGTEGYFNTAAKLKTAGFSQDFGPLSIIGGSPYVLRTLDFGAGDCALAFADSHDQDWNGIPLTIVNYTPGSDTLRFGTNASGLTPAQLASIIFMDQSQIPGEIDAQGFVTPAYPRVLSVQQVAPTTFRLTWNAIPERSYQVQYKTSPDADGWNDAGEAITAEDTIASFDDEAGSDQARFYRIVLTPYQPAS